MSAEQIAAVEALAAEWEGSAGARSTPRIDAFRDAAESLRAALADPAGALVKRDAKVLRAAAEEMPAGLSHVNRSWLRERADRIEAQS